MNRRDFLRTIGCGAAAMALPGCTSFNLKKAVGNKADKKLNFVFILIDDMGWKDLGCYGSTFYETPNIDRLASEGVRFTNAYAACPVCSPTRGSILTGKYPSRLGITQFIGAPDKPTPYRRQMPLEEVTIAEAFKSQGYATCYVGKWHLGKRPYFPENQGFDINIAGHNRGHPASYFHPYKGNYQIALSGGKKGEYLTDRLTDESLKFLDDNANKPFLLYLAHYAVHTPLQSKQVLTDKYKRKAEKLPNDTGPEFIQEYGKHKGRRVQNHPVYAGMIQSVDESVGRVLDKIQQLGASDNTVVIFMSDNGGLCTSQWQDRPTSNLPLRAGKGWLYEGGIREPMIIKWPGVTKAGSVCSEVVTSTDFYPTMLEMANLAAKPEQHVDGVSLAGVLRDNKKLNREAIYWHYPHFHVESGNRPSGAVRAGDYKLIEWYEDNRIELYNLKNDIGEKKDISKKMPRKANELRKMLHRWRKETGAKMPVFNP